MFVEDRDAFVKGAKLNHVIVRYIFAKSLYAVLMDTNLAGYAGGDMEIAEKKKRGLLNLDDFSGRDSKLEMEDVLLDAIASVVMNRFVFESEIMDKFADMVQILTDVSLFGCWRDLKQMDAIDTRDAKFRKCLDVAKSALCGDLPDVVGGAKSFKKFGRGSVFEKFVEPLFSFAGYEFY